jgi:hypothetical protein
LATPPRKGIQNSLLPPLVPVPLLYLLSHPRIVPKGTFLNRRQVPLLRRKSWTSDFYQSQWIIVRQNYQSVAWVSVGPFFSSWLHIYISTNSSSWLY